MGVPTVARIKYTCLCALKGEDGIGEESVEKFHVVVMKSRFPFNRAGLNPASGEMNGENTKSANTRRAAFKLWNYIAHTNKTWLTKTEHNLCCQVRSYDVL